MTRQEVVPERLSGATAVVFDVFMATTTLLTILQNGAGGVYPVASLEEADEVAEKLDAGSLLRGGEHRGLRSRSLPRRICARSRRWERRDLRDHQRHPRHRRRGPGGHGPPRNPPQRQGRSQPPRSRGDGL